MTGPITFASLLIAQHIQMLLYVELYQWLAVFKSYITV